MRWPRSRADAPDEGWTSEVSSGLALSGFLFLVFIGFTLLAMGPLISLDAYFNLDPAPDGWLPVLHVLDRIGQRAVCLPILAVVTFVCCRYRESWRPAWVVACSVFTVNLLVLIFKVLLGRGQPGASDPAFFVGGAAYPSGHTANIILVYGLVAYLLGRYRSIGGTALRVIWSVVALLCVLMVVTSLTLDWHWFADLVAGLLIGGLVLQLTAAVDAAVPPSVLDGGPPALMAALRRRRTARPAEAAATPAVGSRARSGGSSTDPSVVPTAVPRAEPRD
jgi:undecaprenyl-diphosphatase